jgi:hypothetical protein
MGVKTNPSPTFPMFPGGAQAVTPSDTVSLGSPSVIYVGVGGTVKVTTPNGDVATFVGVPTGTVLPVQAILVWASVTSATNMVRIY